MTYQERHAEKMRLVKEAVAGDQWRQIKSGRIATVVTPLDGQRCLTLKHENGRTTRKWADYFADQFEPTGTKASITAQERSIPEPIPMRPIDHPVGGEWACVLCGMKAPMPNISHSCPAELRIREIIREELQRAGVTVDARHE